ncbi:UNKNOWN [Stylonychia lemnae]|uniref:Uncharacterized protein n=1 Tax=Stylonychia lemnae TaxID=5949 RepID=A0A077ZVS3_STYLE|nr:UNKNOWN [Stylonychia lemnae]|eukprot:CDW73716.1 UNKNOWN [Stylonychia lemnae]
MSNQPTSVEVKKQYQENHLQGSQNSQLGEKAAQPVQEAQINENASINNKMFEKIPQFTKEEAGNLIQDEQNHRKDEEQRRHSKARKLLIQKQHLVFIEEVKILKQQEKAKRLNLQYQQAINIKKLEKTYKESILQQQEKYERPLSPSDQQLSNEKTQIMNKDLKSDEKQNIYSEIDRLYSTKSIHNHNRNQSIDIFKTESKPMVTFSDNKMDLISIESPIRFSLNSVNHHGFRNTQTSEVVSTHYQSLRDQNRGGNAEEKVSPPSKRSQQMDNFLKDSKFIERFQNESNQHQVKRLNLNHHQPHFKSFSSNVQNGLNSQRISIPKVQITKPKQTTGTNKKEALMTERKIGNQQQLNQQTTTKSKPTLRIKKAQFNPKQDFMHTGTPSFMKFEKIKLNKDRQQAVSKSNHIIQTSNTKSSTVITPKNKQIASPSAKKNIIILNKTKQVKSPKKSNMIERPMSTRGQSQTNNSKTALMNMKIQLSQITSNINQSVLREFALRSYQQLPIGAVETACLLLIIASFNDQKFILMDQFSWLEIQQKILTYDLELISSIQKFTLQSIGDESKIRAMNIHTFLIEYSIREQRVEQYINQLNPLIQFLKQTKDLFEYLQSQAQGSNTTRYTQNNSIMSNSISLNRSLSKTQRMESILQTQAHTRQPSSQFVEDYYHQTSYECQNQSNQFQTLNNTKHHYSNSNTFYNHSSLAQLLLEQKNAIAASAYHNNLSTSKKLKMNSTQSLKRQKSLIKLEREQKKLKAIFDKEDKLKIEKQNREQEIYYLRQKTEFNSRINSADKSKTEIDKKSIRESSLGRQEYMRALKQQRNDSGYRFYHEEHEKSFRELQQQRQYEQQERIKYAQELKTQKQEFSIQKIVKNDELLRQLQQEIIQNQDYNSTYRFGSSNSSIGMQMQPAIKTQVYPRNTMQTISHHFEPTQARKKI